MTPGDWNKILAKDTPWEDAYPHVENAAKLILEGSPLTPLTTDELVEALYPERQAVGDGIYARRRLYKALKALERHGLAEYCSKGEPRMMKRLKKMIQPRLWHERRPRPTCPHCGQMMP